MVQPDAARLYQLAEDAARHEFSIPIARTMKLEEIQEAHRLAEEGKQAARSCWFHDRPGARESFWRMYQPVSFVALEDGGRSARDIRRYWSS